MSWTLLRGDAARLPLADNSIDAIVCDPPYGLEFMGKEWDSFKTYAGGNPDMKPYRANVADGITATYGYRQKNPRCRQCGKLKRGSGACKCLSPQWDTRQAESAFVFQAWCEEWATEALRVLKPGGHLVAFGGTRTYHRLVCGLEDAGFEIRDEIRYFGGQVGPAPSAWVQGSGFPKSFNVTKALADQICQCRDGRMDGPVADSDGSGQSHRPQSGEQRSLESGAVSDERGPQAGGAWPLCSGCGKPVVPAGFGSALKPAHEPIVLARKPLIGTVAANVLEHGTGALNVDACRVDLNGESWGGNRVNAHEDYSGKVYGQFREQYAKPSNPAGRWPPNVLLSHSPGCKQAGTRQVRGAYGQSTKGDFQNQTEFAHWNAGEAGQQVGYAGPDGLETMPAWQCEPGCVVAELDRQSGTSKSPGSYTRSAAVKNHVYNASNNRPVQHGHDDQGGASRFYPQLNWDPELDFPFLYQAKASRRERSAGLPDGQPVTRLRLRADLTAEQRAYVLAELRKANLDVS